MRGGLASCLSAWEARDRTHLREFREQVDRVHHRVVAEKLLRKHLVWCVVGGRRVRAGHDVRECRTVVEEDGNPDCELFNEVCQLDSTKENAV